MRRTRTEAALWCALIGSTVVFASGTVWRPPSALALPLYDLLLYNVVYVTGAVLCLRRGRSVPGLTALGLALLLNVAGNVLYSLVVVRLDPEPYPSVADAFYLSSYVFLYVAVLGAVRGRVARLQPSMWLDGGVAALGTAAVATASLVGPVIAVTGGERPVAVATNLAYPVADVLLIVLLAASAAVLGLRADRGLVALAVGLLLYLVADLGYLQAVATDTYAEGSLLDVLWLLGTAVLAAAARAPAPRRAAPNAGAHLGWRVLALPLVCSVASIVVLAVGFGEDLPAVSAWLAVACWLASLIRTGMTFREIRDLRGVRDQARTDELTGLPNRRALYERWQRADTATGALVLFDLDRFKEVNDSLGHHVGDALLRLVAVRLRDTVGAGTLAVRLGGDEFAVLVLRAGQGPLVAELVQAALEPPFTVEGVRLHVAASFGVAQVEDEDTPLSEVLRRADVAMYHAKRTRSGVEVYVDDLGKGMADRLRTIDELRVGMGRGELLVHLQTQVDTRSRALVGMEALVRWQHPVRGLLPPAELLPAAEQAGLMGALTDRVLELSLEAVAQWWPQCAVPVSVNLSAANVADLDLPGKVVAALARQGVPPQALVLEVVEDTLMQDPLRAQQVLRALRATGVGVAIDDYGTGYSSLAYLKDLPADELKIDRVFTADLVADGRARSIVEHTVSLAHVLGLRVVAEGVEDGATLDLLAQLGCDAAQGFHVARPAAVADVLAAMRAAGTLVDDTAERAQELEPVRLGG